MRSKKVNVSLSLLSFLNLFLDNLLFLFHFLFFLLVKITFHLGVDKTKNFVVIYFLLIKLRHNLRKVHVFRNNFFIFVKRIKEWSIQIGILFLVLVKTIRYSPGFFNVLLVFLESIHLSLLHSLLIPFGFLSSLREQTKGFRNHIYYWL